MILMPILLMNLLIGLAVGDIESVRRNAQLKRLAMQVISFLFVEISIPRLKEISNSINDYLIIRLKVRGKISG